MSNWWDEPLRAKKAERDALRAELGLPAHVERHTPAWPVRHHWRTRTVYHRGVAMTFPCECRWWRRVAFLLIGR